jgi:hypothetical protein
MAKKEHVDLLYVKPHPALAKTTAECHQVVKEQLVFEGIYPDPDCIPESLIKFIIESWEQVYAAACVDKRAGKNY